MSQESSYHIHLPWNSTSYNSARVCSSTIHLLHAGLKLHCGQHGGSVVSTVASQQEGPGFESWSFQVLSVLSLHVLPVPAWVYSGYSGFPHHHKDMHCIV